MQKILRFMSLVLLCAFFFGSVKTQVQLRVVRQWKYLNYTWPNEEALHNAMANGKYIPENIVTSGLMYYDDFFYLTMPRMKNGVPVTLGRITALQKGSTSPLISPFPSWEYNKEGECSVLQNVQNIEITPNGEMWIIDGGHTASLTPNPVKDCPPKLVIYDIKTNKSVTSYVFAESVASKNNSFLYDLVVDGDFAYITDNSAQDPGIIVFSRMQNRAWKIRHSKTMKADATAKDFKVNGVSISAPINIAGIGLGPKITKSSTGLEVNEDKEVFYAPISSLHMYSMSTSVLKNENNANNGQDYSGEVRDVGLKASQSDGMIMTNQGVLFYGLLSDNSIARWDTKTSFTTGLNKIVSRDPTYIQWTNSFTMDTKGNLTVLTNTLQKFIYDKLDLNQANFWLLSGQVGGKSYLYEDSTYDYKPAGPESTTVRNAATSPSSTTSGNSKAVKNVTTTAAPAPGAADQRIFEFRLLLAVLVLWLYR